MLQRCEVYLSDIVAKFEVRHYRGEECDEIIDLCPDIRAGRVQTFEVSPSDLKRFRDQFDPLYLGDLDDGEAESLAFMFGQAQEFLICSGDAIVFRILGSLNETDRGLSLEEVLQRIGLSRKDLKWPYTKAFREKYTAIGQQDMIQGRGRRGKP